jgi:hypothetical protein
MRRCSDADCANGSLFSVFEALVATAEGWSERLVLAGKPKDDQGTAIPAGMVRA